VHVLHKAIGMKEHGANQWQSNSIGAELRPVALAHRNACSFRIRTSLRPWRSEPPQSEANVIGNQFDGMGCPTVLDAYVNNPGLAAHVM